MALSAVLQGFSALLSFATTALVFRGLSKEDAGIFSLLTSYVIVTSAFIDFGLVAVVFPKMSFVRGANTPSFKAGFVLRGLMMVIGMVGISVYLFITGKSEWIFLILLNYGTVLFSSKISGLRQFFESFLRIKGRTYLVSTLAFVDSLLGFLVILYFFKLHGLSLVRIFMANGLAGIVGFTIISVPVIRRLIKENVWSIKLNFRYYKVILLASLPIALMSVIGQLFSQVETFIINIFLTKTDIASYNAACRPLQGIVFLPVMLSIGLAPVVTQVFRNTRKDIDLSTIIEFGAKIFLALALIVFSVSNIFSEEIISIFGSQYHTSAGLLRLYSFSIGGTFLIVYFDQMLLAVGYRVKVFYGALIGLVIAIVSETLVIQGYGVVGIIFAKMFAMFSVMSFQIFSMTKEMRKGIIDGFIKFVPSILILGCLVYFTENINSLLKGIILILSLFTTVWLFQIFTLKEIRTVRNLNI